MPVITHARMLGKLEKYAGLLWLSVEWDISWVMLGQIFELSLKQ